MHQTIGQTRRCERARGRPHRPCRSEELCEQLQRATVHRRLVELQATHQMIQRYGFDADQRLQVFPRVREVLQGGQESQEQCTNFRWTHMGLRQASIRNRCDLDQE